MQLTKLRLFQYRNIKEMEFVPSGGTDFFIGQNGQGKTNILEAIYFLGYGRSFRTPVPKDCIQHGRQGCRIKGTVSHGTLERDLQISITSKEKKLFLFGKPAALDEFVGNLHVLAFTHEHLKVVRGGPADRRAFLDRAMAALYPGHIGCLAAYGRALKQRNSVLSAMSEGKASADDSLLDSWDETLVSQGMRILWNRVRYVEQMKQELPQGLFGAETLKMHYLSAAADEGKDLREIEDNFRRRLLQLRSYDRRSGYTSVGPHRDDLKLFVNGKSLESFGSAGQQRSCLLALYFSQMEIHYKSQGFYPIFLVDDAEAELDEERLNVFLGYLSHRTQTFLTSAKDCRLPGINDSVSRFEVKNGTVFSPCQKEGENKLEAQSSNSVKS